MRGSQRIVNELMKESALPKMPKMIPYCITHTYDEKSRRFYVEAPYSYEVFDAICAYIQFECSELEETYAMSQEDVIQILEQFYDCKKIERTRANQMDLYENWEYFCGTGLQEVECLEREGMKELLQRIIDNYNEKCVV